MSFKDISYAVLVAITWGSNFVALKTAFAGMPPFLFLTLRFLLCSLPLLWFVPRPKVPWRLMLGISLFQWIAHFSLLFIALYLGMPGGLASLLMQSQIVFTILFSALWLRSRPTPVQLIGVAVALTGLALIGLQTGENGNLISFLLIIGSAMTISVANILFKQVGNVNMLSMVVWSSLIPILPMFALSLYFEGWPQIVQCCQNLDLPCVASICYTSWVATLVGLSAWAYLMNKNDPSHVVSFSLLIPIIGISTTSVFLGETLSANTIIAGTIVMIGLMINQWPTIRSMIFKPGMLQSAAV